MKRNIFLGTVLFLALALVGMVGISAAQDNGPVYSLEGAWQGVVSLFGSQFGTLDTFTSDAQRHGVEGTFLCTFAYVEKDTTPSGVVAFTFSGHGNWVRIDKNKYAFTAQRIIYIEIGGALYGWGKYWGTITPISDNEYTGTMNFQYYSLDGTPFTPVISAALHSYRIPIILEQQ